MTPSYDPAVGPDFIGLVPGAKHRECLAWRIRAARRFRRTLITRMPISSRVTCRLGFLVVRAAKSRWF